MVPQSNDRPRPGVGEHARALFVLLHLVALALPSLPLPTHFDPRSLDTGTGRDQVRLWASSLAQAGMPTDERGLAAAVSRFAPRLIAGRRTLLAPFDPYYDACGTRQAWRLFSFVDEDIIELHVDVVTRGEIQPIYRPRAPAPGWRRPQLDHERFRSLLASVAVSPWHRSGAELVRWLAEGALRDFPGATAARVALFRRRVPTPPEAKRGEAPAGAYDALWIIERQGAPSQQGPGAP